ncbi:MAG: hypothetical protein VKJ09_01705 [Leptolyngbya sp.]|nr:hypothetical protein [Leptolyngbya sp.]
MKFNTFLSAGLLGVSLAAVGLPAMAAPQIASGDRWLEGVDQNGCLRRADQFIQDIGVSSDGGEIDRTGYFDDGTFRILCYGAGSDSMVVVFSAHDDSEDVAYDFTQYALDQIDY